MRVRTPNSSRPSPNESRYALRLCKASYTIMLSMICDLYPTCKGHQVSNAHSIAGGWEQPPQVVQHREHAYGDNHVNVFGDIQHMHLHIIAM